MGIPDGTPLRFVTTFKHEDERSLLGRSRCTELSRLWLQMPNMGCHLLVHVRWAA
jgi:hypothetical protein